MTITHSRSGIVLTVISIMAWLLLLLCSLPALPVHADPLPPDLPIMQNLDWGASGNPMGQGATQDQSTTQLDMAPIQKKLEWGTEDPITGHVWRHRFQISILLDGATTTYGLLTGNVREANPVMAVIVHFTGPYGLLGAKIIQAIVVRHVAEVTARKSFYIQGAVDTSNVYQLLKAAGKL